MTLFLFFFDTFATGALTYSSRTNRGVRYSIGISWGRPGAGQCKNRACLPHTTNKHRSTIVWKSGVS